MRLNEFDITGSDDNELPFNVAADLNMFMKNDPIFYRKHYFPCMSQMSDMHSKGTEIDFAECARPMLQAAMEQYCRKFNLTNSPQSLFTSEDEDAIIEMLKSEEMPRIEAGEY